MDNKKVVGVIFGGPSGEHEVSCKSASSIIKNLDNAKYEVIAIGVSREGKWYGPIPHSEVASFDFSNYLEKEVYILPIPDKGKLYKRNTHEEIVQLDVVFEIIHGTYGEDGKLQALLEIAKIPYVGSGVTGSAVGMDKIICRQILNAVDIPQVNYVSILRSEWEKEKEAVIIGIESELNYPLFVKPANMGSSVGISKANNQLELSDGIAKASLFDRRIIVEEGIEMREIELSVLGNDEVFVSLPGEIFSATSFYDYEAKYFNNQSSTKVPADLSEEQIADLQFLAKKAYKALDLSGLSRVDFFIEKETGKIYLNEVNTLPGFTEISMYAQMWKASNLEMDMLLEELINLAFLRMNDLKRNEIINKR